MLRLIWRVSFNKTTNATWWIWNAFWTCLESFTHLFAIEFLWYSLKILQALFACCFCEMELRKSHHESWLQERFGTALQSWTDMCFWHLKTQEQCQSKQKASITIAPFKIPGPGWGKPLYFLKGSDSLKLKQNEAIRLVWEGGLLTSLETCKLVQSCSKFQSVKLLFIGPFQQARLSWWGEPVNNAQCDKFWDLEGSARFCNSRNSHACFLPQVTSSS